MKNKFAMELKEALSRHPNLVEHKVAEQAYMSKAQLSRIKNGTRKSDPQLRQRLAIIINDYFLHYTTAASNHHIISFQYDRKLRGDMFSALMKQRDEQSQREELEPKFEQVMTIKPEFRTPEQNLIIERYPKEYAEEISSEITDLARKAQYVGIPMDKLQKVIDEVNEEEG